MENFIINRNDAFLMLIDIQDRLFHAMTPQVQKMLKKNCNILLRLPLNSIFL